MWLSLATNEGESSLREVNIFGLDIAKQTFRVHGADVAGEVVIRRKLLRADVIAPPDSKHQAFRMVTQQPVECTSWVKTGLRLHRRSGPLPKVKRKERVEKRTLPLEGRLSGVERSYQRRGPNRRL